MRPQQSAFGEDAYPDIHLKAGALMHSLARNHACFYARNAWRLDLERGEAVRFGP
jgi:prophage maintenance system killer protein